MRMRFDLTAVVCVDMKGAWKRQKGWHPREGKRGGMGGWKEGHGKGIWRAMEKAFARVQVKGLA